MSVVRESTQASAAANKERDEMPVPQLTQAGKFSCCDDYSFSLTVSHKFIFNFVILV